VNRRGDVVDTARAGSTKRALPASDRHRHRRGRIALASRRHARAISCRRRRKNRLRDASQWSGGSRRGAVIVAVPFFVACCSNVLAEVCSLDRSSREPLGAMRVEPQHPAPDRLQTDPADAGCLRARANPFKARRFCAARQRTSSACSRLRSAILPHSQSTCFSGQSSIPYLRIVVPWALVGGVEVI
jgi:hypothetical protein